MRVLDDAFRLIGPATGIYSVTIAVTAFASIAARTAERRNEARETLKLLMRARRG